MQPVAFTAAGFRRGSRRSLGVVIVILPFGLVAGIAAEGRGLSLAEATLFGVLTFAGAAQLLALAAWTHPVPILAVTLAAFVVNLRLALMGAVLSPWLERLRGWRLWASLFVMADHNWALSVTEMQGGGRDAAFLFGSGSMLWLAWVVSSAAGYLLGTAIQPPPGHPLFFAAIAVFVAMLALIWRGRGDVLPWAVAALVALGVARLLPGTSWHIAAGALAGSLTGALRDQWRGLPAPAR